MSSNNIISNDLDARNEEGSRRGNAETAPIVAGSHHRHSHSWFCHPPTRGKVEDLSFDQVRLKKTEIPTKDRQDRDIADFCMHLFFFNNDENNDLLEEHALEYFEEISSSTELQDDDTKKAAMTKYVFNFLKSEEKKQKLQIEFLLSILVN